MKARTRSRKFSCVNSTSISSIVGASFNQSNICRCKDPRPCDSTTPKYAFTCPKIPLMVVIIKWKNSEAAYGSAAMLCCRSSRTAASLTGILDASSCCACCIFSTVIVDSSLCQSTRRKMSHVCEIVGPNTATTTGHARRNPVVRAVVSQYLPLHMGKGMETPSRRSLSGSLQQCPYSRSRASSDNQNRSPAECRASPHTLPPCRFPINWLVPMPSFRLPSPSTFPCQWFPILVAV
ncbi:hypothetical protein EDD17DRAFT_1129589 [Pisolithus thermaeus]|nr:hypothetical protein EDD17DRAFT_1129589 [Pisolithus thermaeus]